MLNLRLISKTKDTHRAEPVAEVDKILPSCLAVSEEGRECLKTRGLVKEDKVWGDRPVRSRRRCDGLLGESFAELEGPLGELSSNVSDDEVNGN